MKSSGCTGSAFERQCPRRADLLPRRKISTLRGLLGLYAVSPTPNGVYDFRSVGFRIPSVLIDITRRPRVHEFAFGHTTFHLTNYTASYQQESLPSDNAWLVCPPRGNQFVGVENESGKFTKGTIH